MMTIDISMPLAPEMPIWPGSPPFRTQDSKSIANGDPVNATTIEMDVHCGTHVDAPLHLIDSGPSIDKIDLEVFNGEAWVADTGEARAIGATELDAAGIPEDSRRLLLRTGNSRNAQMETSRFAEDYCALAPDGADWIVSRGITLVGIDYLSIQRFGDPPDVHLTLLEAGVAILEGLVLRDAPEGHGVLTCMPLLIPGAEAAPARASLAVAT